MAKENRPIKPIIRKESNPSGSNNDNPPKKEEFVDNTPEIEKEGIPQAEPEIISNTEDNSTEVDILDLGDDLLKELEALRGDTTSTISDPVIEVPDFSEPVVETNLIVEYETPPKVEKNAAEIEIPYDPESSYFFMYGVNASGKTVILSGLFYNLMAHRMGDNLKNLNDHSLDYQKRGTVLLDNLMEHVPSGKFPPGTTTLTAESQFVPRQINLKFGPKDHSKPEFKFTMMDMSGEDLMRVRVSSDDDHQSLQPGIETFLTLPHNNLAFICVYPAHSDKSNHELSSYMRSFLDELDRIGHTNSPIIFVVSKWDMVKDKYNSVEEFFLDKDPIMWNKICESERNATTMKFSIGEVDVSSDSFKYNPSNSNELFKWMYKTQMGVSLDEDLSDSSGFGGIMKRLFGKK